MQRLCVLFFLLLVCVIGKDLNDEQTNDSDQMIQYEEVTQEEIVEEVNEEERKDDDDYDDSGERQGEEGEVEEDVEIDYEILDGDVQEPEREQIEFEEPRNIFTPSVGWTSSSLLKIGNFILASLFIGAFVIIVCPNAHIYLLGTSHDRRRLLKNS
eukprot:TRINITY_DN4058_c0_g1_i1.p1 TRINITY_DN4058_c0_g1~~TRINITY_DN4058_c0_g1_i1.p1  ORF type:complete len:156 (-),score=42.34 TRINITY_DN4058_c0_g1_i1:134-601(-)